MDDCGGQNLLAFYSLVRLTGPFLGADLHSNSRGIAAGVKEGPRRRRGCLDAGEYPATISSRRSDFSGYCGWVEFIDQLLVSDFEPWIIVARVFLDEGDDFPVAFGSLSAVSPGLVDHTEAIVAVMPLGKALQQLSSSTFGFVQISRMDHVDNGVGCVRQFVGNLIVR